MKKPVAVNIGGAFEPDAIRILRAVPGLTVTAEQGRGRDAYIRGHGRQTPICVQFKRGANAATAWQLVHDAESQPRRRWLLVAGETTEEARRILQDHGIALVDGLGNAHIELPGLLVHLAGRRRPKTTRGKTPPTRLQGKAGLVAQALLLDPKRPWKVADLVERAAVSAGLAHRVLTRLEREEILVSEGAGPKRVRCVVRPGALLDLWTEEGAYRPTRTAAHVLTQTPEQLIKQIDRSLRRGGIQHALTAAAAASLVAPFITAVPVVEVWAQSTASAEELCEAAGASEVTEGENVVFVQAKDDGPLAFRDQARGHWVVNRFRLYSDLRHDPRRGREQADHLRREVIGF